MVEVANAPSKTCMKENTRGAPGAQPFQHQVERELIAGRGLGHTKQSDWKGELAVLVIVSASPCVYVTAVTALRARGTLAVCVCTGSGRARDEVVTRRGHGGVVL